MQIHRNLSAGPWWRPSTAIQCLRKAQQVHKAGWATKWSLGAPPSPCVLFLVYGSGENEMYRLLSLVGLSYPCLALALVR